MAAGDKVSSYLTAKGDFYSWGRVAKDTEHPVARRVDAVGSRSIQLVKHGPNHTVALTTRGRALVWSNDRTSRIVPREIPSKNEEEEQQEQQNRNDDNGLVFKDAGCTERHALLLREDGHAVYEYEFGRKKSLQQQLVNFGRIKVSSLDCGAHHSAAVSDKGHLYTWGWGEYGRLGHGDEELRDKPEMVVSLAERSVSIVAVACGAAHTSVVSNDGTVFGFGWNAYGQVSSIEVDRYMFPREIFVGHQVTSISCGFCHSGVVTSAGLLFTWGFNGEGQLGLGHENNIDSPTRVDAFPEDDSSRFVVSVACGHLHTVCLTSNLSPHDIELYEQQVKAKEQSEKILLRFARSLLLRLRLRRYRYANDPTEGSPNHAEASTECDNYQCESDSDLSDHGFMSSNDEGDKENGNATANNLGNEAIRQHQERIAMAREDNRSKCVALHEQAVRAAEEQRVRAEAEEARLQTELELMRAEDMAAQLVRSDEGRRKKEARHKRARQKMADRNARVTASIQREANRLKAARQRQQQQALAKTALPIVNRRRRTSAAPAASAADTTRRRNQNTENRLPSNNGIVVQQRRQQQASSLHERNQTLLERRKARLEEQQRIEDEQRQKREQELEKARQLEEDRLRLLERETERLEIERKRQVDRNLQELKEKLGLCGESCHNNTGDSEDAGQRRFTFKSTAEWNSSLSNNRR